MKFRDYINFDNIYDFYSYSYLTILCFKKNERIGYPIYRREPNKGLDKNCRIVKSDCGHLPKLVFSKVKLQNLFALRILSKENSITKTK